MEEARLGFVVLGAGASGCYAGMESARRATRHRAVVVASAADSAALTRRAALRTAAGVAALGLFGAAQGAAPALVMQALAEDMEEITYTTTKAGWVDGPTPRAGDLVGIRFRATCNGTQIDNTLETPTPFYFRLGNGNIVKGLEQAVFRMHIGEVAHVVVPGTLAFGKQGRRAGPGRPSIPPFATIVYDVELTEYPGFERELLEVTGGEDLES